MFALVCMLTVYPPSQTRIIIALQPKYMYIPYTVDHAKSTSEFSNDDFLQNVYMCSTDF